ncbi:MAG: hypothetical protein U0234_32945 [Sandaracinus sp.]
MRRALSPDWQDRIAETQRAMQDVRAAEDAGADDRELRELQREHRAAMRHLVNALPSSMRRQMKLPRLRRGMTTGLRK